MDSEVQQFREKIKCLEDELCEKLTIISDQAEALDIKNTRSVVVSKVCPKLDLIPCLVYLFFSIFTSIFGDRQDPRAGEGVEKEQ